MNIAVEYIDQTGTTHNQVHRLTRLAFAKHMAFAGHGYRITPNKVMRTLGMFFHYSYYLQRHDFYNNNRFSLPPRILSDPTEQNHFSNIAGKAIADFLSKRIDRSFLTLNYEAVAPRPMRGQRPDLVAFSENAVITIEAKGRKSNNPGNMADHKRQANSGNLPRHFSIACVSYDLYNSVKCNYHDPFNDNIEYNNEGLRESSAKFYNNLSEFLNINYFEVDRVTYQDELFYEVSLSPDKLFKYFADFDYYPYFHIWCHEFFYNFRPRLILPKNIQEYGKFGLTRDTKPFYFYSKDNNIYIDNDRIGLRIR